MEATDSERPANNESKATDKPEDRSLDRSVDIREAESIINKKLVGVKVNNVDLLSPDPVKASNQPSRETARSKQSKAPAIEADHEDQAVTSPRNMAAKKKKKKKKKYLPPLEQDALSQSITEL